MGDPIPVINYLLAHPGKFKPLLEIIKGARNGVVYGTKIRAPHAFVMTFLFRECSFREKVRFILRATYLHAKNLASMVFIYKSLTALLFWKTQERKQWHVFLSAFVGGYIVFGENNPINNQIVLYLFSRILFGLAKTAVKRGVIPRPKVKVFPWLAALVWGVVLWLFEYERDTLQDSLRASMTYLYDDSNTWHNLTDFLLYNRMPRN